MVEKEVTGPFSKVATKIRKNIRGFLDPYAQPIFFARKEIQNHRCTSSKSSRYFNFYLGKFMFKSIITVCTDFSRALFVIESINTLVIFCCPG